MGSGLLRQGGMLAEPLAEQSRVCRPMLWISSEQVAEFDSISQVALIITFRGRDHGWRNEVVLRRGHLHDEAAPEQFADQGLEYQVGGKILFQVIVRAHDRFDRLADTLPD